MAGRELDLHLHLLDRQVIDTDQRLVCKVDDVEIVFDDAGRPIVTAILAGPAALGPRLGGRIGRWVTAIAERLSSGELPRRIGWEHVISVDNAITVNRSARELGVDAFEAWVDSRVVSRIPGSTHASE